MRKRVLLAEESQAIRGVAETLLRQNGFDVVSVTSGERAREVISLSRPDVMIIGAELKTASGHSLHEMIKDEPRAKGIPMLVLADAEALPLPHEAVLPRPFDPREFVQMTKALSDQSKRSGAQRSADNEPADEELDDHLLDAALGIDQLRVTDSEVMGDMKTRPDAEGTEPDNMVGLGYQEEEGDDDTGSQKVESIVIQENCTDIHSRPRQDKDKDSEEDLSGSKKIDILDDQYGLTDPNALNAESEDPEHDYNWFVNEMRQEIDGVDGDPGQESTPSASAKAAPKSADSGNLKISDAAVSPEPIVPPPGKAAGGAAHAPGVEKFIDEFRREIERVSDSDVEAALAGPESVGSLTPDTTAIKWQETLEKVSLQEVSLFTSQFASELAQKVAALIVDKIDDEKLMQFLKKELMARISQTSRPK